MADALRTIKNKIKDIYGDDWFDNSYIIDWKVSDFFKNDVSNEPTGLSCWDCLLLAISFGLIKSSRGTSPPVTH